MFFEVVVGVLLNTVFQMTGCFVPESFVGLLLGCRLVGGGGSFECVGTMCFFYYIYAMWFMARASALSFLNQIKSSQKKLDDFNISLPCIKYPTNNQTIATCLDFMV